MVPPSQIFDCSIGFAGMVTTISTPLVAQTQALWLTAYLGGKLAVNGSQEEINWQTILHSQFGKWRYRCGYGERYPDFVFDALPYLDLGSHRKKRKIAEWLEPYGPENYKTLD